MARLAVLAFLAVGGLVAQVQVQAQAQTVVAISSLAELYAIHADSDLDVTMAAGVYTLDVASKATDFGGEWLVDTTGHWPGLFNFSGSNNVWRFHGVTIQLNTEVLADFSSLAHGSLVEFSGSDQRFEGLTWEHLPTSDGLYGTWQHVSGGTAIKHSGSDNVVSHFSVRTRGSEPYGWGAIMGKTGSSSGTFPGVRLSKLSSYLFADAQNPTLQDSVVDHSGLGHVVFFSGSSQGILIQNCEIYGETRSTDDLRADPVGGVDRNGVPFNIRYEGTRYSSTASTANAAVFLADIFTTDDLDACQSLDGGSQFPSIRPGYQFALTEDGLRSYGDAVEVTVRNTLVSGTRSGLQNGQSTYASKMEGVTFRGLAGHGVPSCDGAWNSADPDFDASAVEPPSGSVITGCKADAPFSTALAIDKNCANAVTHTLVDLEILDPEDGVYRRPLMDTLAFVNGLYHRVRLLKADGVALTEPLVIKAGDGDCATQELLLCNLTPQPVTLSSAVSDAVVYSVGAVTDAGTDNAVTLLASNADEPDVCKIVARGTFRSSAEEVRYTARVVIAGTTDSGFTSNCGWFGCRVASMNLDGTKGLVLGHGKQEPERFYIRPVGGVTPATDCVQWGDVIVVARTADVVETAACGWYGCRVARIDAAATGLAFGHGTGSTPFYVRPRFGVAASGCVTTGSEFFLAVDADASDTATCGPYGCQVLSSDGTAPVISDGTTAMANPRGLYFRSWDGALGPSASPTASPTKSPTAEPTGSPVSSAPTVNPTQAPSAAPTTLEPTGSPTEAPTVPKCSLADTAVWVSGDGKSEMDADVLTCAIDSCSLDDIASPNVNPAVVVCMDECVKDQAKYTADCSACFADFGVCLLRVCSCPFGRGQSDLCEACSLAACEPAFGVCTGRDLTVPAFVEIDVEVGGGDSDGDGDGDDAPSTSDQMPIIIGAAAGSAFLVGALALFLARRRHRSSRINSRAGPTANGSVSVESDNPKYGAAPAAASSSSPPAFVLFDVKFAFKAAFDDELGCKAGDVLHGVKPIGTDRQWWFCRNPATGKEGMVPANAITQRA